MMQLLSYLFCNHGNLMKPCPNVLLALIVLSISITSLAGPLIAIEHRTLDGNVYARLLNDENDTLTFRDGSFHSELSDRKMHPPIADGVRDRWLRRPRLWPDPAGWH